MKKRGPDHTEHKIIQYYHFVHVLLSMTGKNFTIQPFVYDNIVIMFNGEIYNYKDFGNFNFKLKSNYSLFSKIQDYGAKVEFSGTF